MLDIDQYLYLCYMTGVWTCAFVLISCCFYWVWKDRDLKPVPKMIIALGVGFILLIILSVPVYFGVLWHMGKL